MAFELKKSEAVPDGIRRLVRERIDHVLDAIAQGGGRGRSESTSDKVVHEARKQFKQVRGALRLVRDELGPKCFDHENRAFRDLGRPLSVLRDARVLLDVFDDLLKHFATEVAPATFRSIRRSIRAEYDQVKRRVLQKEHSFSRIAAQVRAAKRRVDDWPLRHKGWKALEGGLQRVYRQARNAMREARRDGSDEAFHEWRKRTKDLRYGLELLVRSSPELLEPLVDQAHHLTNLLGSDHDLAVLRDFVQDQPDLTDSTCEVLTGLIDARRAALRNEAIKLGRAVYEEKPVEFIKRMRGYWKAWHSPDDGTLLET
jgi:CHAD domain-containing protein